MKVRDVARSDSQFFLKSVYGPFGDDWPAMSYTRPQLKTFLHRHYRLGSDFILYTGTSGPETEIEENRGRLLSILSIDLTKSYRTADVVSEDMWRWAQEKYPGQWEFSLGVVRAWNFEPRHLSTTVLSHSYPLMGQFPNPGMALKISPEERASIMDLDIVEIPFIVQPAMNAALTLQALLHDRALNVEAVRIAGLVFNRVAVSGSVQVRTAPERNAPTDFLLRVGEMLRVQPLCCALCGGLIPLDPHNRLMQPSPDRIDSSSGSYGPDNFHIAHLACNLAKNDATVAEFQEWLSIAAAQPTAADIERKII